MKDYSYHKKVIDDVITKLNESDIDLYLIICWAVASYLSRA